MPGHMKIKGKIAIDLDGTLAHYDNFRGDDHIGKPIPKMIDFVKQLIRAKYEIVIFSARADNEQSRILISNWCHKQGLGNLDVTNIKRKDFKSFYDDRAYQVKRNTGQIILDEVVSNAKSSALSDQVGGDHYSKMAIQPVEFCYKNKLGAIESNIIKYICRHKVKNGEQDLEKAKHLINLLIELEY